MNVKNRALLLVSMILIVLSIYYFYEAITRFNSEIDIAIQDQEELIDNITHNIKDYSYTPYLYKIKHFITDNEDIQRAFAERDRDRLYDLSISPYSDFQEENHHFHAMDYNLPDGEVFLRVQKPEKFGDNISESRPIVADVHKNRKLRSGFDIGKHGAIFWVAAPVFYQGTYVGAVEFGIETKQIEEAIAKSVKSEVTTVLKGNAWQKAELMKSGFQDYGDYVLMTRGNTLFSRASDHVDFSLLQDQKFELNGKTYVLHSCAPLNDFYGASIGRLVLFQDISAKVQKKRNFIVQAFIITGILLILSFIILYYSFGILIGRLEHSNGEATMAKNLLQQAHDGLEQKIRERTEELAKTNESLKKEVLDKKRAEVKLQAQGNFLESIIESLTHPFYVIDTASHVVVMANQAACNLSGVQSYQGLTCYKMTHKSETPCSGTEHPCPLKEVKKKKIPTMVEHVHYDQKGNERYFEIYAYPIFDTYGNVSQIVEYNIDITDRKKSDDEKNKLRSQLLSAQKMEAVGILAGGVAHDFNNVLTTILGYSQIMALKLDEEDPMREMVGDIYDAAERAAGLTRQLLAFSRKQVMEMKVADLNEIVGNISKMLKRLIGENIEMQLSLAEAIGNVRVDAGQIEQILMNLVVNARDAIPDGGNISIETCEVEFDEQYTAEHLDVKPGLYAMLTVTDSGAGMSKEVQEKIFEPFYTTKELGKGTGLGLATVYGIAKQHGAHIYVYSELGKGTTFKIYFPVVGGSIEDRKKKELRIMPPGDETIMVVDDDASIRRVVRDTLEPLGYNIIEAGSGEDALALYKRTDENIDLILSDLIMPGINGQELIDTLAKEHFVVKTILMSGYTDNIVIQNGVLKPDVIFLNKPLLPVALAQMIREVLDTKGEGDGLV